MNCNVCDTAASAPIFESSGSTVLTSLCELRNGQVQVWSCSGCGHLYGAALQNSEEYYSTDYRILLDHDDEDQIYETGPHGIVYRTEHQLRTLLSKVAIPDGARVLDYGCAKASTPRRLFEARPDLQLHLFDVSDMYLEYWKRFIPPHRYSINATPGDWAGQFDLVTSYFALEHIPRPAETIAQIGHLLRKGGTFYCVVPDTFGNIADFVVLDHVNHFTAESLRHLLAASGFVEIDIDSQVHRGAHVVTAIRDPLDRNDALDAGRPTPTEIDKANARALEISAFWMGIDSRIRKSELAAGSQGSVIYGSGFYGAYIMSVLQKKEHVACFLDRSPFQQGKTLLERPIVAPEQMPGSAKVVYVGLNPAIARAAIAEVPALASRDLTFFYLNGNPK